jgi:hypothetical protein
MRCDKPNGVFPQGQYNVTSAPGTEVPPCNA